MSATDVNGQLLYSYRNPDYTPVSRLDIDSGEHHDCFSLVWKCRPVSHNPLVFRCGESFILRLARSLQ